MELFGLTLRLGQKILDLVHDRRVVELRQHFRLRRFGHLKTQGRGDQQLLHARGQLRGALNEAIAGLRPLYRDVFVLRAVDELSTAETARALGVTISTVKTRLRRARRELRDSLESCGAVAQNINPLAQQGSPEACPAA